MNSVSDMQFNYYIKTENRAYLNNAWFCMLWFFYSHLRKFPKLIEQEVKNQED